jgi:hypothetical protein
LEHSFGLVSATAVPATTAFFIADHVNKVHHDASTDPLSD